MKIIQCSLLLATAAAFAACSSDTTGNTANQGTGGQLGVVNATAFTIGAQLKLDNAAVALPSVGQATAVSVSNGTHQLQLYSSTGQQLASTSFAITDGARRTAVFTGTSATAVSLSMVQDTISTHPGGQYTYVSNVGSMMFVNAVAGSGPYGLVLRPAGSDSIYHLGGFAFGAGSLPPPAPFSYYLEFPPAAYTIDLTLPGSSTPITSTQFTMAKDDRWVITLTNSVEGDLTLQAVKQP